jgi:hypothetical protein
MRGTLRSRRNGAWLLPVLWLACLPVGAGEVEADLLVYRVESPGEPGSLRRMLATPDYLRLDMGEGDPGFVLFDRRERVIYSVDPGERNILEIDPPPLSREIPPDLSIELRNPPLMEVPAVAGVTPVHWQLLANGDICREAILAPGLMPQVVTAYRDYLLLLAAQQAVSLPAVPEEFRGPCDSVLNVYAPDALWAKGLPLRLWDGRGYQEVLTDFGSGRRVPAERFALPEGYEHQPMGAGFQAPRERQPLR